MGALVSLLFVQVLPWAIQLSKGADLHFTPTRMLGVVIVFALTMALGGFFAYLLGDAATARDAIFLGLGWQGALGGFVQGRRVAEDEARYDG